MSDEYLDGIMARIALNQELCKNGEKHDFKGWVDLKDENGNVIGGTTVCTKCGLDAFTHSLRYGP